MEFQVDIAGSVPEVWPDNLTYMVTDNTPLSIPLIFALPTTHGFYQGFFPDQDEACGIQNIYDKTCQESADLDCTIPVQADKSFTITVRTDSADKILVEFGFNIEVTWNDDY